MYKLTPNGDAVMLGSMSIPFDERNRHYQEYLVWLADGNTPESADIPVEEPKKVTKAEYALLSKDEKDALLFKMLQRDGLVE